MKLSDLPQEIILNIINKVDIITAINFSKTCEINKKYVNCILLKYENKENYENFTSENVFTDGHNIIVSKPYMIDDIEFIIKVKKPVLIKYSKDYFSLKTYNIKLKDMFYIVYNISKIIDEENFLYIHDSLYHGKIEELNNKVLKKSLYLFISNIFLYICFEIIEELITHRIQSNLVFINTIIGITIIIIEILKQNKILIKIYKQNKKQNVNIDRYKKIIKIGTFELEYR
jgi:hypothetical protein